MHRLFAALLALAGLLAPSVQAGPWARAPGEVFLSYSHNLATTADALAAGDMRMEAFSSLYGEVGLGRRLTLGLDLGRGTYTDEALIFLRRTLTRPDATWQVALDFGLGQRRVARELLPCMRFPTSPEGGASVNTGSLKAVSRAVRSRVRKRAAISEWADAAAARAWGKVAEHSLVQAKGRDQYYASYTLYACANPRTHDWKNEDEQ